MNHIVIGGAWPYANGSLHIGHIAALLPGDVLARYWRAKGRSVFYVSGSDCHGTPITLRASKEGRSPRDISDAYHEEFCRVFESLGFSYDAYNKTSHESHIAFVKAFHQKLYQSKYVEERTVKQAHCPSCQKILTDRLIAGTCPSSGAATRGDQCDACGSILDVDTVINARCATCGSELNFGETTQLFLLVSQLEKELKTLLESRHWRRNAVAFTKRYIDEGLQDRAITRDLDWGIDVPREGYENKKIYIWAENVLGYLSACAGLCRQRGVAFEEVFGEGSRHYYVHGKDNIPFHTIILPSLLIAHGEGFHLPDDIISSEYVTLEGSKISTSRNWAVWAKDMVAQYNPDAIRYFFLANGPEKRDTDFSWREFCEQNNTELVGAWGNFVNRTLLFIRKYRAGLIPTGEIGETLRHKVTNAFDSVGQKIENGFFRDALDEIFALVRFGNKYYDLGEPWKTRTQDPSACSITLWECTYLIANLSVLLRPFLPFSSDKLIEWLGASYEWKEQIPRAKAVPEAYTALFERLQKEEED